MRAGGHERNALRALRSFYKVHSTDQAARDMLDRAIAIDPTLAPAYAMLAVWSCGIGGIISPQIRTARLESGQPRANAGCLVPTCIRQRPIGMTGPWQGFQARVRRRSGAIDVASNSFGGRRHLIEFTYSAGKFRRSASDRSCRA